MRQNVDITKWKIPEGVSIKEAESAATATGRGDRQMNGISSSSRPEEPPPSCPHLQVYIGAHDYLVMVGAAAPPPLAAASQPNEIEDQDAVPVAGAPAVSDSRNRISTSRDFLYGKVEVRAKVAPDGFSGFWLRPSEERVVGHTPCARVAIAEVEEGSSRLSYKCFVYEVGPLRERLVGAQKNVG